MGGLCQLERDGIGKATFKSYTIRDGLASDVLLSGRRMKRVTYGLVRRKESVNLCHPQDM